MSDHGEVADDVVVALLGVGEGEGEAGADLHGLAGGMTAVGLDERVVDALGQVNRKWRSACGLIEAAMPTARVYRARILRTPRSLQGFFQLDSNRYTAPAWRWPSMCRARASLKRREQDDAAFAALALGDADAAGVQVDVGDPDPDEPGDPDAGVEQGLDHDDIAAREAFRTALQNAWISASVGTYGSFLGVRVTSTPS